MLQEIIFTTLPHKRIKIDGKDFLKLSVYTSIKLQTPSDTNLGTYQNIIDWAEKIKNADFKFKLGDGKIINAELNSTQIDVDLYKSIFHNKIKVDDFKEEDFSNKLFLSVPLVHIQNFILTNLKDAAIKEPKRLISADKFIDVKSFAAISNIKLDDKKIATTEEKIQKKKTIKPLYAKQIIKKTTGVKGFKQDLRLKKYVRFNPKMRPKTDFIQLREFHRVDKKFATRTNYKIKKPVFEFHNIMAVINSYPQIMRKMGLIMDFVIPYDQTIAAAGTIKIVPETLDLDPANTTISIPATAYEITETGFYVADKTNSMFSKGFVKINTNQFAVIQVDADGAALKTTNMVETKVNEIAQFYQIRSEVALKKDKEEIEKSLTVEPPKEEGLPFLRTSGIAITKNGMAEYLHASIKLNTNLIKEFKLAQPKTFQIKKDLLVTQTPKYVSLKIKEPEVVLYSNEIVQGYRMDIAYKEAPFTWYSLHQKKDKYTWFNEQNEGKEIAGIKPDEGFIQLGLTEDIDNSDDIFVSETLARWEGWSLSVHKPGFAINEAEDYTLKAGETQKRDFVNTDKKTEAKKYLFNPDLEFRINASSKIVNGSLPKLRFGKDYQVRIRTVDLAGNSVAIDFQSETPESTLRSNIRYMRYEPLASPIVLVGNKLKDGEFLERMVIRSNYDQSAVEYEDSHEENGSFYDEYSQRYLLPPKNSQLIAETHGMFEKAFTNNPQAAQQIYSIITAHEGTYKQKEKNKEQIYKASEVEIIYLPDPMAAGVALFVSEGNENTHSQNFKAQMFSFFHNDKVSPSQTNSKIPEDWYNQAKPITLRLEEGTTNTKWNPQKRIFTIFLPKGHRTRIKFSTFWREEDLNKLSALWQLVKGDKPANINELKKLAYSGQHWMVSPSREMELVHAVQQPVDKPKIEVIYPERDFGETTVAINTRFDIHGESTDKIELRSKWVDPIDDGISVTIKEKEASGSISNIPIHYHDDKITKGQIPAPEFVLNPRIVQMEVKPHTRIPKVTKTQFKKNPQPGAKKINNLYKPQLQQLQLYEKGKSVKQINMVDRLKLDLMEPKLLLVRDLNLRIKPLTQSFGDTKHRWVSYQMVASSRYREYFDKLLAQNPDLKTTRESDWIENVNILSTARPKPPEIDYIIPTFEWKKTANSQSILHQRLGGGLRIFIKRPWYSSGIDEKLAVIISPKKGNMAPVLKTYDEDYTNWGIDPLLFSTKPSGNGPNSSDFRHNPEIDSNLTYPDSNKKATAVAYPVHFDEERQIWYCDIAVNPKEMYFPFIKLVVARYQKHAVRKDNKDVCLSTTVTTDMLQLVPERKAILSFTNNQKSKLKITVKGAIYNERYAKYGNYNYVRISFVDTLNAKPINGIIQVEKKQPKVLSAATKIFDIKSGTIKNNQFNIIHNFTLPDKYKTAPYKVLIEEYERGPVNMDVPQRYKKRLEQSSETDRLIYADVFEVNQK